MKTISLLSIVVAIESCASVPNNDLGTDPATEPITAENYPFILPNTTASKAIQSAESPNRKDALSAIDALLKEIESK